MLHIRNRSAARAALLLLLPLLLLAVPSPAVGGSSSSPLEMAPALVPAPLPAAGEAPQPARIAERDGLAPLATLAPAAAGAGDALQALRAWNAAGNRPLRTGVVRDLPVPRRVRLVADRTELGPDLSGGLGLRSGSGPVWGAEVVVEGAHALKLHLGDVELPDGALLWVYGERGEARGPFGTEAVVDGGLWTPSVPGPAIRLEVELPAGGAGAASFVVDRVAETVVPLADIAPRVDSSCLVNAGCVSDVDVPFIEQFQSSTALIAFPEGRFIFICSGNLLNSESQRPFFLTANHCVSTQAAAAGADLFWDFATTCEGEPKELLNSFGAKLLATGRSSDFTLLELSSFPGPRWLLGWNGTPEAVAPGTVLHRVSHPADEDGIFPQRYSRHRILGEPNLCSPGDSGRPVNDLTRFAYTELLEGGTLGGSSGSALINDDGQVVGQLLGGCGPNPGEGCDRANQDLDGLFRETLKFIGSWLDDPDGKGFVPPPDGQWIFSPSLPGFDAKVQVTAGAPVEGQLETDCIPQTLCASGALAGRPEVFVKVIGPRPNGFLWTQVSRFTPSLVEVWLRHLASGEINYYILDAVPRGADAIPGLLDREAFRE